MNLMTWWQYGRLPAAIFLLMAIIHTVSSETRVVCYYTNWSVYRPGTAKFSPQNINPYLCTHLIYAFGGFTKENSLKPFDKYQDIEKGGYAKFTGLKTYNKNLKTMLAIGGWNEGSSRFSPMVASADRRKELVKNTVKFLRQNHFDGLDLDWEYPSFRDGGKPRDKENYAQLVQELREEFNRESEKTGRPRLLLTMAVPAGIEYVNKGYDIPKLNKYLDWMNILSYDYHSAFEPAVNHHSPLYPLEEDNEYNYDGDLNIDHTIKHYLKLGADSSKLVLGIPTYGRSYTLFNPDAYELGAPADGPGDMGDATRENGYLAFYEICENLKENDWKVVQPNPDAMGPYAYKGNQWVSYDDELIVRKKSKYVAENNLGGIMFWSIDNDDFRGNCYNKAYPLIEAAKEALITAAASKTDSNFVSVTKSKKPTLRPRRPTSTKKETDSTTTHVQNSGGRQGGDEIPTSSGRKRIRTGSRNKSKEEIPVDRNEVKTRRNTGRGNGRRRRPSTTTSTTVASTIPSTLSTTPMYKTPEPPTTPDPGGDFKCEEDGFFPHPRDCKKYFWCLSGPADLGIIAHQFTCPAGLYFNKAADSCDYTQNVLCNKKLKTTTTTPSSTTASTTEATQATTTRKVPLRITAATSRTTFLYTTTTTTEEPEYYDEYEYEDEDLENSPRRGEPDSEEDPKVIKELIDLIKKVGGVEELEKFLKLQEDGSMAVSNSGSTTPATISRSLYEKVLNRANSGKTNIRNSLTYSEISRSRRPDSQKEETEKAESQNENSAKKGRPQYTTITRQRSSTEKSVDEETNYEDEEEEEEPTKRTRQFLTRNQPEYVTIRRSRPTATTEENEDVSPTRTRHRVIPGETNEDEDDITATQRPEYVTIQRSRPPVEETTTSKYAIIQRRRPTTETSENIEISTDNAQRSTTSSPKENSLEKDHRYRSTTSSDVLSTSTILTDTTLEDTKKTVTEEETIATVTNEAKSTMEASTDKVENQSPITELTQSSPEVAQSTTLVQTEEISTVDKSNQISDPQSEKKESNSEKSSPQLFRPRPFTTRSRSTTVRPTTEATETSVKKTQSSRPFFFRRPSLRFPPGKATLSSTPSPSTPTPPPRTIRQPPRRRFTSRDNTTSSGTSSDNTNAVSASNRVTVSTTQKPRFKFASRRPYLKPTSPTTVTTSSTTEEVDISNENDQMIESSVQRLTPHENQDNSIQETEDKKKDSLEEIADIALTLYPLNQAPLPGRRRRNNSTSTTTEKFDLIRTRQRTRISTTSRPQTTTIASTTPSSLRRRRPQPQPFEKVTQVPIIATTGSYQPITIEYDYYDEGDVRILGQLPANSKVLIHASGVIQCLDQGNFPHPVSCKKFISCAKMENGDVIGWEYTCPNRLSFDPVGGICNWSAGLGCRE